MNPFSPLSDTFNTVKILFNISFRYLLFTGVFYLFFYVWKKRKYWAAKIQQRYPENKHVLREIGFSCLSMVIFGVVVMMVVWAGKKGLTLIYTPPQHYSWMWYLGSIVLMIMVHDTYFYFTHRAMHWKPIFKYVHKVHHLSTNPTPFAAYAFHPVEALVEVGIIPLVAFIVPHQPSAVTVFALYSLLLNVLGHLGYELFPKGFASHKWFKWHNTSTHHNMHHRLVKCNYGLYFNFWDRVMGTNHPHYEESYNEAVERRQEAKMAQSANEVLV